jgi:hypothetical protein
LLKLRESFGGTMKKILAFVIALLILPALVISVFAPAAAMAPAPFKGSIQAIETHNIIPPTMFVKGTGSGNATLLGLFKYRYQVQVDLVTKTGSGLSAYFTAANGDHLYAKGTGQGGPSGTPGVNKVTESFTITGGTGRFAGASGSFVMVRLVNTVTGKVSGTFEGNVVMH